MLSCINMNCDLTKEQRLGMMLSIILSKKKWVENILQCQRIPYLIIHYLTLQWITKSAQMMSNHKYVLKCCTLTSCYHKISLEMS